MSLSVLSVRSKSKNRASTITTMDNELMLKSLSDDLDTLRHINTLYDPTTDEYSVLDHTHLINLLQQPRYVKVYKKSKRSGKMFQRLFLAQELIPDIDDKSSIWVMKFSKDGKFFAVGRQDGVITIWKVISSPLSRLESQLSSSNRNRSLSTSSSSTTKANSSVQSMSSTGGNDIGPDRSLLVCPESSYKINNTVFAPIFEEKPIRHFKAHSSGIISLDWSKNNFLISGSMDNTAKLWHIDRQESLQLFKHDEFVTSVNFHPTDDRFFLSACMDSQVRLWSILDGEVSFKRELPGLITAATFTPDGETCVVGGLGWCSVLETRGLDKKYDFHIKGSGSTESHGPKVTGIELYDEVANNTKSTKLIITTNDSRIRKFNINTRTVETKFKGLANDHSQIVARVSENNGFLVAGSENHWCYIWSLSTEGELSNKEKAKETFKKIFTPSSSKTSSAHDSRQPAIAGTYKNSNYLVFHAHHADVTCATFAPIATSKLIELSNDPLYELHANYQLCVSQKLPISVPYDDSLSPSVSRKDSSTSLSSTLLLHRNAAEDELHPELSLIVTADKNGNIRVFRRDFVYNIRKALRHDFHNKYKNKKIDFGDTSSIMSGGLRPQASRAKDSHHSFIPTKPVTTAIDTDSFIPLGLGTIDSLQHLETYSLSSDSSMEIGVRRSHTAKERPLEYNINGDADTPDLKDLNLSSARGRKRVSSIDQQKQLPQVLPQ